LAFLQIKELFDKYHIVKGTYHQCVNDTFIKIQEATIKYALDWFKIVVNGAIVGYTCLSRAYNILYSFAINKEYRKREVLSSWVATIIPMLQENFTCTLWNKNKRAIDFLKKFKMYQIDSTDQFTVLKYHPCL